MPPAGCELVDSPCRLRRLSGLPSLCGGRRCSRCDHPLELPRREVHLHRTLTAGHSQPAHGTRAGGGLPRVAGKARATPGGQANHPCWSEMLPRPASWRTRQCRTASVLLRHCLPFAPRSTVSSSRLVDRCSVGNARWGWQETRPCMENAALSVPRRNAAMLPGLCNSSRSSFQGGPAT